MWFDNFYYFFTDEDTRDAFGIPHDLNILAEVFRCNDGDYAATNAYWQSYHLIKLIEQATEEQRLNWSTKVDTLREVYGWLSDRYQSGKGRQGIPLGTRAGGVERPCLMDTRRGFGLIGITGRVIRAGSAGRDALSESSEL